MATKQEKVGNAIDWIIVGTAVAPAVVDILKGLVFSLIRDIPEEELDKRMLEALSRIRFLDTEIQRKAGV